MGGGGGGGGAHTHTGGRRQAAGGSSRGGSSSSSLSAQERRDAELDEYDKNWSAQREVEQWGHNLRGYDRLANKERRAMLGDEQVRDRGLVCQ